MEVYRAVLPGLRAEVSLQEFQAAASLVLELPTLREQYSEPVPDGRVGSTAAYAVRLLNRRGESAGFSNIAAVPLLTALPAPAAIHLRVTERAILLEWPPVPGARGLSPVSRHRRRPVGTDRPNRRNRVMPMRSSTMAATTATWCGRFRPRGRFAPRAPTLRWRLLVPKIYFRRKYRQT